MTILGYELLKVQHSLPQADFESALFRHVFKADVSIAHVSSLSEARGVAFDTETFAGVA